MELFYSTDIRDNIVTLDRDESTHCIRVLRHGAGDRINVMDGRGNMMECEITAADAKAAQAVVVGTVPDYGARGYVLEMAVCPTKNPSRYEWFAEKATELGVDSIVPVVAAHSERKNLNSDRVQRILLSAAKQSLKAYVPELRPLVKMADYLRGCDKDALRLIAYCDSSLDLSERRGIVDRLEEFMRTRGARKPKIAVLIGPEGDFAPEEIALARECGWTGIELGASRLRTETAALSSVAAVYFAMPRLLSSSL